MVNGKTEQYIIPIDKRIYVFEDVDCQSEVVLQRKEEIYPDSGLEPTPAPTTDFMPFQAFGQDRFATGIMTKAPEPIPTAGAEKLTLSTLLNLLDGILETPGRIIIMTSNYPKKLDKALIRPGRIDLICEFGLCTRTMIQDMINTFYDVSIDWDRVKTLPENTWSPAELMKVLFENFENPEGALKILHASTLPKLPKLRDIMDDEFGVL
jgi:chaperone BCS1